MKTVEAPRVNLDDYITLEFTTSNGEKYQVGYPTDGGQDEESLRAELSKLDFSEKNASIYRELNCPPDEVGYVSPGAQAIGIANAYVLSSSHATIYTYRLWFENTKGWGFDFKDDSGDVYGITTILNRWHYIDYNSPKPTMVGVM